MHRTNEVVQNIHVIILTHSNTFKRRITHARARVTTRYMYSLYHDRKKILILIKWKPICNKFRNCYSAAEYACPVWARSTHAHKLNPALHDCCRIISGCLKPTNLDSVHILAGIAPIRKQRVKIGQSYSDYTNVASGVPQGSCTGPLLFILYSNALPDYNSDMNTDISLFADDSKISIVLSDVSERSTMQERLNQFMEWADRWQLQIAEHKCCVLTHGSDILPTYNLNGVQLLNVKEFRDLGIIVDADCLFKQHISHICRKAYCSINVIFRCFHTANIAALIISYKSFVRPMLEYCSTVWNPYIPARHYLGMTGQVEKVQRYFTRRVYQRCQLNCNHSYLQRLA